MNKRSLIRLILAAAVLIAGTLAFVLTGAGGLLEPQALIRTYLPDAAGLAANAPVRLNGIIAGHVKQTVLTGSSDPRRAVEVDLMVPQSYLARIPVDSTAGITAANLLGDKYIDISRGTRPETVKDGGEIASQQTDDLPEVIAQSYALLSQFQPLLTRLDALLTDAKQGQGNVGQLFTDTSLQEKFNTTAAEVRQALTDARNSQGVMGHISDLSGDIDKPMKRMDDMMADFKKMPDYSQISTEGKAAMADANVAMDEAKKLLDEVKAGHRIDDLDAQMTEISKKFDLAMDKFDALEANPQLPDALAAASKEFHRAMAAYNRNPKKFRTVKIALF